MPEVSFPFKVREVVEFGRYMSQSAEDATEHCMKSAEVYHLKERVFSELSGGEKRRVMFARVMNQGTPVMLLDEPVSMLDIRNRLQIMELIVNNEKTAVVTIHDVNLAMEYFDRLIFMKNGHLVFDLRKSEVDQHVISEVFDVKVSGSAGHFSFYL
jgi:iron complex transport system ATP-binding protein